MDELISRQDAIDALNEVDDGASISTAITVIDGLPSAQPEPQCNECPERQEARQTIAKYLRKEPHWIPCSERLPEEGVKVLLTDIGCDMAIGCLVRTDEGYKWYMESWWDNTEGRQAWKAWWDNLEDWQAWTSLPEPWKGEGHEID